MIRFVVAMMAAALGATGAPQFSYSILVGGSINPLLDNVGGAITVDGLGQAHVAVQSAYVLKLNAAGTAPLYQTFLPGVSRLYGIALDAAGNAYVTGWVGNPYNDFPQTARLPQIERPTHGVFVAKLDPAGKIVYALLLSSRANTVNTLLTEAGTAIAVDREGYAYVGGEVIGEIPTTANAYQRQRTPNAAGCLGDLSPRLCREGFVMKINRGGTDLVWSTYLNGSELDGVKAIAVDGPEW